MSEMDAEQAGGQSPRAAAAATHRGPADYRRTPERRKDELQLALRIASHVCLIENTGADPHLLVLRANSDRKQVSLDEEESAIKSKFGITMASIGAVTPGDFRRALRGAKARLVHFMGHGTADGLVLAVGRAGAPTVAPERIAALFKPHNVELAVFNCCQSLEVAEAVRKYVPYVIATTSAVPDKTAEAFGAAFWEVLGDAEQLDTAFEQAVAISSAPPGLYHLFAREPPSMLETRSRLVIPKLAAWHAPAGCTDRSIVATAIRGIVKDTDVDGVPSRISAAQLGYVATTLCREVAQGARAALSPWGDARAQSVARLAADICRAKEALAEVFRRHDKTDRGTAAAEGLAQHAFYAFRLIGDLKNAAGQQAPSIVLQLLSCASDADAVARVEAELQQAGAAVVQLVGKLPDPDPPRAEPTASKASPMLSDQYVAWCGAMHRIPSATCGLVAAAFGGAVVQLYQARPANQGYGEALVAALESAEDLSATNAATITLLVARLEQRLGPNSPPVKKGRALLAQLAEG